MRASATSLLAVAAAAGLLLLSSPLAAQGFGQPRELFPQGESWPAPPSAPHDVQVPQLPQDETGRDAPGLEAPGGFEGEEAQREEPGATARRSLLGGVEVDELQGSLPETLGTLEPAEGGLGLDLWRGSDRDDLIRLIRVVPDDIESPALRSLARRLLLSSASPPTRTASFASSAELLRVRAERLYALGLQEELLDLLQRLPREAAEDPLLARLHLESALISRQRAQACRLAEAGIERFSSDPFWQEALIYCQISEGRERAANLGLSLLREAGDGDQQVLQLAEAALGLADLPAVRDASALTLAYLNAIDAPPPSGLIEQAPYAFLGVLARQVTLPADERLPLVERAVQFGLLDGRALARAYEGERFDLSALEEPLVVAAEKEGPQARALLYKAAWRAGSAEEKLELLEAFRERAAQEDLDLAALLVASELLLDVHPEPALAAAAPLVVESLLTAGRLEQASAWTTMLRTAAAREESARRAYSVIWPAARLAGIEQEGVLTLGSWAQARTFGADPAEHDRERVFLQLLLEGLEGEEMRHSTVTLSRPGGAAPPAPSVLYSLQHAAADGRRGETALLVLQLLGGGSLGDEHPQTLAESLAALVEVGLHSDARAIAVESLLVQSS